MTNGTSPTRQPVEPQPGDRAPAPGELGLVQAFINTRWDLNDQFEDQFPSPSALAVWLAERQLLTPGTELTSADLDRALVMREGLRAVLFVNNGATPDHAAIERLNGALAPSPLAFRFDRGAVPDLISSGDGLDAALGSLSRIIAVAQVDGSWARLKACRGAHCGWAFYDHSRNLSGSWCSMSTCGSRSKARAYRRRKRR